MQASHPLLAGAITPTLLRLAAPNVVAMMAQAFVAIAETAYAGRLGVASLAALALAFPIVMLQQMMSAGAMGGGISSAVSRALGGGEKTRATALAKHAVVIGLAAGLVITVLMLATGPAIFRALGGRGAALEQAIVYSNIVFLGAVPTWLTNTLASILRGTGNMRAPSLILLGAALGQAVLSGALALGIGPIPRFGMAGLAAGQVIAMSAAALTLGMLLMRRQASLRLSFAGFEPDRTLFRDILKVGAIAIISPIQSVATVLIVTALVARTSVEALAGYGIGARLEFLLVPIVFAVGVAAVPMVGMAIGAGQVARARRVAWTAATVAGLVTGSIGLVVALVPDVWVTLYADDPRVLAQGRAYLTLAGPTYAFYGFGLALYFASQGSGQIVGPVLAQSARLAVIIVGAMAIARWGASASAAYAVVAAAMVVYGLASALSLYLARWGSR
jgi:putative MATE family efflux protein